MRELTARVKAQLRRSRLLREELSKTNETAQHATLAFDNLVINLTRREATLDGKPIQLKPKEYELLEFSRIESGRLALDLQPVSPFDLLFSACQRMQLQAERAGLNLRVECATDLPKVMIDSQRLEQALVNLIHNAVKFTKAGGRGGPFRGGSCRRGPIRCSRYGNRNPRRGGLPHLRALLPRG